MPRTPLVLSGYILFTAAAAAFADGPAERYAKAVRVEDETSRKLVERIQKPGDTERERWFKRLDEVYTGRVPEDPTAWYDLVTTGRGEWTRETSKFFAEFHERVCQRMELKKTDVIYRDAFAAYARRFLGEDSPYWRTVDVDEESRGPFKQLDLNRDGLLTQDECSPALADRFAQADLNADGKIDPAEYKAYFRTRVGYEVQTTVPLDERQKEERKRDDQLKEQLTKEEKERELADAKPTTYRDPKTWPKEVPDWFRKFDGDDDRQIGLYEWKASNRPLSEFLAMDLNGDGLLEVPEYLRFLKLKAQGEIRTPELRAALPEAKKK